MLGVRTNSVHTSAQTAALQSNAPFALQCTSSDRTRRRCGKPTTVGTHQVHTEEAGRQSEYEALNRSAKDRFTPLLSRQAHTRLIKKSKRLNTCSSPFFSVLWAAFVTRRRGRQLPEAHPPLKNPKPSKRQDSRLKTENQETHSFSEGGLDTLRQRASGVPSSQ